MLLWAPTACGPILVSTRRVSFNARKGCRPYTNYPKIKGVLELIDCTNNGTHWNTWKNLVMFDWNAQATIGTTLFFDVAKMY
jgi:hypothetical protein